MPSVTLSVPAQLASTQPAVPVVAQLHNVQLMAPVATQLPSTQHIVPVTTHLPSSQSVAPQIVVQHVVPQTTAAASSIAASVVPQSGRGRKRPIDVFVDPATRFVPQGSPAQRPRIDARVPLGKRCDSANSTPSPTPRDDAASFSQSPSDPFWTGKENEDPSPTDTPELVVAAFPHDPSAPIGPPPPSTSRARTNRPARVARLPLPQNIELYLILNLDDWKVSKKQILSAWRHVSLDLHPDRVAAEDRDVATLMMQQINAAKDVLTDSAARRQYHLTGTLPIGM